MEKDKYTAEREVMYCVLSCGADKDCPLKQRGLSLLLMRFLHEQSGDSVWGFLCGDGA